MRVRVINVIICCALVLCGCCADTYETVLMRHEPGERAIVNKTPYNGTYRLYAGGERTPTTRSATPVIDRVLRRGTALGFAVDRERQLVAVVGAERTVLGLPGKENGGVYVWTMQADAGQIDGVRTAIFVVATCMILGVVAAAIVAPSAVGYALVTI